LDYKWRIAALPEYINTAFRKVKMVFILKTNQVLIKLAYKAVQHPALSILEISFGQSELAILDTNEISANPIVPFRHK
jgi:hypothetical protein